ncbi:MULTISPECIES: hypothetical protein [unclassified Rhizobium]|uniref:hypothetical protein n=1 Tax=unclassified Rhizobium TaxID=2613769 RepID=UPI001ADB965F|nr:MULTISPECIES: hypothetical protein [unclassified Rhizobium]MBO9127954.1 hypothetical protein [Rhizobium sp. 16-488-2b]MBO9178531.1 hypothetical protein [Rhizobium sp. 16-488-2a]
MCYPADHQNTSTVAKMRFDRLSHQAFERLIQALVKKEFGPGTVVFGSGRDGGREATYSGKLKGFEGKQWHGYTVVQAKCRENCVGGIEDARWLAGQLSKDLQKFLDRPNLKRPEFYLLCSNVTLSGLPQIGGKDLIEATFRKFAKRLGLKGWHVWAADELHALLDDASEIRRSYAAWLTPSDVLAQLMDLLVGTDMKRALPIALSKDVRSDRDARLRDAGHDTIRPVALEHVFVDLPVLVPVEPPEAYTIGSDDDVSRDSEPEFEFPDYGADENEDDPRLCVSTILAIACDKLDPSSLSVMRRPGPQRNRIVVMGGPGQGKSTIGQFLCQLLRARLLKETVGLNLGPETEQAVDEIRRAAHELGLPAVGPARLPFRLELPALADALRAHGDLTVLGFLAQTLAAKTNEAVGVPQIRKLLEAFPTLFVFDGLDEVPPSANRGAVLHAIEGFWDEVYASSADVLALVTTRPQGYDNDLDSSHWEHWHLVPLSSEQAVDYATKLANIRVTEEHRKEEILADIALACRDPSTALLTSSPLQVAILFGISFLKGNIPRDKWTLFDRYYGLLRDRESVKPGAPGDFIRKHVLLIDKLHQTCGWLLQVESEVSGRTGSYFSESQFRAVIASMLIEEEQPTSAIDEMTDHLVAVATNRLVLIGSRIEGRISFDVRSLQEYLAAASMFGGGETSYPKNARGCFKRALAQCVPYRFQPNFLYHFHGAPAGAGNQHCRLP